MSTPTLSKPRLQSLKRITRLLFTISVWGFLAMLVIEWLHVPGVASFGLLLFYPMLVPSGALLWLLYLHEENRKLVVRHLSHTCLSAPGFGRCVAALIADLLILGAFVLLPGILSFPQIFEWASPRAEVGQPWVFWTLAMGAGWIAVVVGSIHAYISLLPTTRLQARPGLWLLGLRMTDRKGQCLTRAKPRPYLTVRRPADDKDQLKLHQTP